MGVAIPIPRELPDSDADRRLRRLRSLAWLLDRSIPIGRWRIGLDPILGLLPGAGDFIGAALSLYVLYEGARLGMPGRVLVRMGANILVEAILGAVPVLGDLFDFAWQANSRNLALIDAHYRSHFETRSPGRIGYGVLVFAVALLALLAGAIYVVARAVLALFA